MKSPKWKGWSIPGGRIEEGETEEQALIREVKEEMGIEITNIIKVAESVKLPSNDFINPEMTFHFSSFFAKAIQTEIKPNEEISEFGWFSIEEAGKLDFVDSVKPLFEKYAEKIKLKL